MYQNINLAPNAKYFQTLVNTVINIPTPQNEGKFLTW